MTTITKNINESACLTFLCKYGKGTLTNSMIQFFDDSGNMQNKYDNWLKWYKDNNVNFDGKVEHIVIKSLNIDKFIFTYEWEDCQGWPELFQYLYNINKEIVR